MNTSAKSTHFTPRQARIISALIAAQASGAWLSREAIDRVAGASNGPHIILQIRRIAGHDGVVTERRDVKDKDGKTVQAGYYQLTALGHQRLVNAGFKPE